MGAVTQGKGFWFTEVASITGAYASAKLQGKDPLSPAIGAGIGNVIGARTGKVVTDKFKPVVSGTVAEVIGAGSGAISSEVAGSTIEDKLNKNWSKK